MKKYKKDGLLVFLTVIFILLTLLFFYLLNIIKIWTFNSYVVTSINNNEVMVIVSDSKIKLFRENSFFYYDTKKYSYELLDSNEYDEGIILTLELERKIHLTDKSSTIMLPNKKRTIFSLIIDSWRSKWKN